MPTTTAPPGAPPVKDGAAPKGKNAGTKPPAAPKDAADPKPAAPKPPAPPKLDVKDVEQIKKWEAEADGLTSEADAFRSQAAGLIVKLLDADATEREVAEAIGKSPAHVHFAATAWRMLQDESNGLPDFNTAYKAAKRPEPKESADDQGENAEESADVPFPPWAKQMKALKALVAEMVDQANLKQSNSLGTTLEKGARAAYSKAQDLEGVPGQP